MKDFVGIILGGDMNSYAVARAFFEKYKIKTIILGQHPLFPVTYSKLTECYYNEQILEKKVLLDELKKIDDKYPNTKKIVFSNTDYYVKVMIYNRKDILKISDNFIVPTIDKELFDTLFNKNTFYELCEKYDLPHPKSISFDVQNDDIENFKIPFEYPIFMKPSNTDTFSRLTFKNRQKVYKIESFAEFCTKMHEIRDGKYKDKFIIQEYIESYDDDMYVYTYYANKNFKVEVCTAGKILMHDRTPELIGNYNAITNAYDEELSYKLKEFVEKIKFKGICHFAIIYEQKRKKYIVLEINIRQGRSNLYTLASGVNLAEYVVNDYIYNKETEFRIANKEFTVSLVPKHFLEKVLKESNMHYKIKNFYRFTLAPYDFNLIRLYYQHSWDKKIMAGYEKYKNN